MKKRASAKGKKAQTRVAPHRTAAADESDVAMEVGRSLGPVIRRARRQHEQTLQQLAERSKLSVSYLSQIERNLLTPSVSTLKRIADALNIPAGNLMFAPDNGVTRSPVALMRKGSRKSVGFPQSSIRYELLTPDLRRRMSLLWLVAEPGAESGPAFTHSGEDVVVVLRGGLSVEVAGTWYELEKGDSIYFNSEISHRWRNGGTKIAEAIWVSSPPSF